ncbi:High affinity cAMP-specific 3',5'-cyclic phosphodiesterase 7A [Clydaea vesicula]|uniref:Phosphodiesterase n=1 Tax=Clydaea vesicula TaxID=447962 RepID=A0AAD5U709_9FUNG|nr:High affinity cAMP-specific 3',5'-cyclic phosphodiesterase 7A [Clydaea vesicula]KAJ3397625.1 High affinity cAMP-specific 3',5'-cyclic phosphodiesterase 7A [Lobulomyces angularis]
MPAEQTPHNPTAGTPTIILNNTSSIPQQKEQISSTNEPQSSPTNVKSLIHNHSSKFSETSDKENHGMIKNHSAIVETTSNHSGGKKQSSRGSSRIHMIDTDPFDLQNRDILMQWAIHYVWFGALLIIASYVSWITLWFWTLPLYGFSAYSAWQITRITHILKPDSLIPLYISFIPYAIFQVLAREAHMICSILWFITTMSITLQLGQSKIERHIIYAVLCYSGTYIAIVIMQYYAYYDLNSTTQPVLAFAIDMSYRFLQQASADVENPCPAENDGYEVILIGKKCYYIDGLVLSQNIEVTFGISILLLGSALWMLQRFIQEYAFSLLDRKNHLTNLTKINADLKVQLKALNKETNLDLDSPITKVIKVIKGIQLSSDFDAEMMENLDHVIEILSSNQLFLPTFFKEGNGDSEVNKWLNAMVLNQTAGVSQQKSIENLDVCDLKEVIVKEIQPNSSQIEDILKGCDSWDFDIFELYDATMGQPIFYLAYHIFAKYGFLEIYQIDDSIFRNFLKQLEAGYKPNPYHNSTHAADVMHAVHYFLSVLGLNELVGIDDCFSGIIAALIHDFDHPGQNNAFLINTYSELAIRYNDSAVLEHYHCAKAFELILYGKNCNIFSKLPKEKFKSIRQSILTMVLATDMSGHFEYISKFKNKTSGSGLDFKDPKDRQLIMDIAIKCGDIANSSRPLHLCKKWAGLVMDEFWIQGDEEKKRNIPVSMFMDRNNCIVSKSQVGFIDYIATPLYEVWDNYMNEEDIFPGFRNIAENREYWKKTFELDLMELGSSINLQKSDFNSLFREKLNPSNLIKVRLNLDFSFFDMNFFNLLNEFNNLEVLSIRGGNFYSNSLKSYDNKCLTNLTSVFKNLKELELEVYGLFSFTIKHLFSKFLKEKAKNLRILVLKGEFNSYNGSVSLNSLSVILKNLEYLEIDFCLHFDDDIEKYLIVPKLKGKK